MSTNRFRGGRGGRGAFGGRSKTDEIPTKGVHPSILKSARKSGQLNLSNRELGTVPDSVWRINIDVPEETKNVTLDNQDERWWDQAELTKLILASNKLTELSNDVNLLPALVVLDIHDNEISSIPPTIAELRNLQRLNLGHNKLTELPECMSSLVNLSLLHVEHNQLSHLPEDIGKLTSLEDLNVSHNNLTSLPASLGYLTHVMKCNFANNNLQEIPPEIGSMRGLRTLELTHNKLNSLPAELGDLEKLQQLSIRHNKLTHLPLLRACKDLKELNIGNNAILGLTPEHLEHLQAVSVLVLNDNKLAKLPEEITLLQGLERLDLTNNDLTGLPYVLGTLQKLKAIVLDGNPMKSIRRDIIMRGTNEIKKYLRSRMDEPVAPTQGGAKGVQSTQGASGVIGDAGDKVNAHDVASSKSLDYSGKKVSEIPTDIWELVSNNEITDANFSKNTLTKYPENIVLMSSTLLNLNLSINRINALHPDISLCMKLQTLNLSNNQISQLPQEMTSLQSLREITLSYNRFPMIPAVLYELPNLEVILISDNQIADIPVSQLKKLQKLSTLDLQNNAIRNVPPELGTCDNLRALKLEGNLFKAPRPAILAKGTLAILEYLKGRIVT
ncbi:unnamed protein product [Owenia fusiformis]|uniref:Uncharacterized protein n=1 Tax=Owenia fusiformis TaxID=6347 RepID=A0A8J1YAH2_OWEFU|nr:unnamed protein product [Owenia fusiformis]